MEPPGYGVKAWFELSVRPFLFPPGATWRTLRFVEISVVGWAILFVRPTVDLAEPQLLYAIGGTAAGFVHHALLSTRFDACREGSGLLPWRRLGGIPVERLLAPLLTAITFLVYAAFEEVLWRFTLQQQLLGGGVLAVPAVAALFTLTHLLPGRPTLVQAVDLASLALLLGAAVFVTGSLTAAVFMHWARNLGVLRYATAGRR